MATVEDSKLELIFEEQICSLLFKRILDFHRAKAARDEVCDRHKFHIVLVPVGFQRFHQLAFVLVEDDVKQTRHLFNLRGGESDFFTVVLLGMERNYRNIFAVQVFVERIARNLDDVFASHFASSDVRSVSSGIRTRRSVAGAAKDFHCVL